MSTKDSVQYKLFTEWYKKYHNLVKSVCEDYEKNPLLQEELCQDVWLAIWVGLPSFKYESDPSTWIYGVAQNVSKNYIRDTINKEPIEILDSQLTPPTEEEEGSEDALGGSWIEETVASPYGNVEDMVALDQLVFSGASLTEQEAAVFNLVYWHGYSYQAVSEKFDIDIRTVGAIATKLRDKLEGGFKGHVPRGGYVYHSPSAVWSDWSWKGCNGPWVQKSI